MKRSYKKMQNGQTLVEVIIGIAIAVMLTVSLISSNIITSRTSRSAKNTTQATKLAEENIEEMRILRDRRGFTYLANGSCYKLISADPDPAQWTLQVCNTADISTQDIQKFETTSFYRYINVSDTNPVNADKKLITVFVTWLEQGGTRSIKNQTILTRRVNF